ncbi:hypothetical protein BDF21DRAFT_430656 [Thamnidium elegans]|nr:hypothetical protein BDF21DRAFT_430656 [Thamnidium elegans]
MDDFNSNIKYTFNPDPNGDGFYIVKLPTEHIINMIPNTPQAKRYTLIENNTKLEIKHADIKAFFFDPIITNILALIQMQLDQALGTATFINTIFLLGGFSRNPYLQQRVYDEYKGRYSVVIPEDGVTAVSKGAVSYGLNPRLIRTKFSGHSVALEVRAPFSKYEDGRFNKKENFENRLEYFVHQSDFLRGERLGLFHKKVIVDYPNNAVIAVFACDFKEEDDRENWIYVSRRHIKILEEIIKLPEVEEINKGDPIQFVVCLNMYGSGTTITIECQNIHINRKIKEMNNGNVTSLKVVRKCDLVVLKNEKALIEYS